MYPHSKYAIPPPMEETVHVQDLNPDDPLPAALISDVKHAFVRSGDGNFIAIDRYVITYGQKEIIGILGDGFVPITIDKRPGGEESVRADFTCSYRDVHNSPATVILMKGNRSFQEHYYKRGKNTTFSANNDRFRTMLILCKDLPFTRGISRDPPLILTSPDKTFSLSIGSAFALPTPAKQKQKVGRATAETRTAKRENTVQPYRLVHCLNPVYGLKDPRWIMEYLEYHRAIGVQHVHYYMVTNAPEVSDVLQMFRSEDFVTIHDWTHKASGGYTSKMSYEHAKWAAQTDCALRARGVYDYALFSDIDEVVVGPNSSSQIGYPNGHLAPVLDICDEAKTKRGKVAFSFNSNTVTSIYTKFSEEEEIAMKDELILERYDRIEAGPHCPSNCRCVNEACTVVERKFHLGRQKYIAHLGDLTIPPRPMWTHAVGRNYTEMDDIMEILPDEVMHVRHYQGHWYLHHQGLLNSIREVEVSL
jgi:hypothetical protein